MRICTATTPWRDGEGPGIHPDAYVAHGQASSDTRALRRCPHCGENFEIPKDASVRCFECGKPGADVITEVKIDDTDPVQWMGVEVHSYHFPGLLAP